MTNITPQQLLAQIAAIEHMEKGKLSPYIPRGRSADTTPYHKLQFWEGGRNRTRHVRPEELTRLNEALEGYALFQKLMRDYAQLIIERTRAERTADIKKKIQPYSRHCPPESSRRSKA